MIDGLLVVVRCVLGAVVVAFTDLCTTDCCSLGTDAERASTRRSFSTSAIRPPSRRRRPPPSRASTPTFARRPSTLPRAFNVLPATPVVVANHATATFAFDAGLLYVLNDASDIAQLDALNALVALLARLAAALIEPRWYVPYYESLILR